MGGSEAGRVRAGIRSSSLLDEERMFFFQYTTLSPPRQPWKTEAIHPPIFTYGTLLFACVSYSMVV